MIVFLKILILLFVVLGMIYVGWYLMTDDDEPQFWVEENRCQDQK